MFEISKLKTMKLPELQEIAKGLKVPKFKTLKKLDLVYQILDLQATNPKAVVAAATPVLEGKTEAVSTKKTSEETNEITKDVPLKAAEVRRKPNPRPRKPREGDSPSTRNEADAPSANNTETPTRKTASPIRLERTKPETTPNKKELEGEEQNNGRVQNNRPNRRPENKQKIETQGLLKNLRSKGTIHSTPPSNKTGKIRIKTVQRKTLITTKN
jgi:transcription termination factor Rho